MKRRLIGSALLLVGGALHTSLAFDRYGPPELVEMFFLNGIASAIAATALALTRGWFAAVAAIAVSAMSLVAFVLSRVGNGVLGFRGRGFDPPPEALLTVLSEAAAVAVLSMIVLERRGEILQTLKTAAAARRSKAEI